MCSYSTRLKELAYKTASPQQQLQRRTAGQGSGTAPLHAPFDRATSCFIRARSFADKIYVRVGRT